MGKLKRINTCEVSKLLKEVIMYYTDKSWTLSTDFTEKFGEAITVNVWEEFSEKFGVLTGHHVDFWGCYDYNEFMSKASGYYKTPRIFTFTPKQEEYYEDNSISPPYDLLNDLLDLAEVEASNFYGKHHCTWPVTSVVKKYCSRS